MSSIRPVNRAARRAKGFTLLEMMLVVVIIGLLVGVAVINLAGQSTVARKGSTEATLRTVQNAVTSYFTTNGQYPGSVSALIPTLLAKEPKDAWKHALIYYVTPSDPTHPYILFSMGEDGQASTQDDINVWTIGE